MQSANLSNNVDLNSLESGKGNLPVLFLHGLNESLEGYRPAIRYLDDHLHTFALDLRGHGLSPWLEPYRVLDYAADVTDFVQARIGEPVILAGHSLGGLVAAFVAAQRPEMVRALILEDPPLYTAQMPTIRDTPFYPVFMEVRKLLQAHHESGRSEAELKTVVGDWHLGGEDSPTFVEVFGPEYVSRLALEFHRTDPRTLDAVLDGTLFEGLKPDEFLPKIACPTLLISGSYANGGAMRKQDIERVSSLILSCSHVPWDDLGHDIHTIRPRAYAQEVLSFFGSIKPLT